MTTSLSTLAARAHTAAFTFVEILAALMFLALVIPAIVTALSLSNRAGELTERGGSAGQLAENKLNEMLVGDAWQSGAVTSGDFGADWPNYRWEMTRNTWSTDSGLTELKVEVFFKIQGVERGVTLTTLVNTLTSATTTTTGSSGGINR